MKQKRIVVLGGGTGSYVLLSGLKKYPLDLTAVVSMADDGGSTGILRDELGVLPPGDVRQCLVALSDSSVTLRELMNYRFDSGGLDGHSFGNLLLSALEKITGDFGNAVEEATRILKVTGEVVPVTTHQAHLRVRLGDGTVLEGEDALNRADIRHAEVEEIYFSPRVRANPRAVERIRHADMIVIGPGNHYCSILPSLVLGGIARAVRESNAMVVYVANLTNKKGHTEGWDVDDYVHAIEGYVGRGRIDYVILNIEEPGRELLARYEKQEGRNSLVRFVSGRKRKRTFRLVKGHFLSQRPASYSPADKLAHLRAFIRHDPERLATAVVYLAQAGDHKSIIQEIE